jgi:hypothetical protein
LSNGNKVNNGQFGVEMACCPPFQRIVDRRMTLPAFASVAPGDQPDAERP